MAVVEQPQTIPVNSEKSQTELQLAEKNRNILLEDWIYKKREKDFLERKLKNLPKKRKPDLFDLFKNQDEIDNEVKALNRQKIVLSIKILTLQKEMDNLDTKEIPAARQELVELRDAQKPGPNKEATSEATVLVDPTQPLTWKATALITAAKYLLTVLAIILTAGLIRRFMPNSVAASGINYLGNAAENSAHILGNTVKGAVDVATNLGTNALVGARNGILSGYKLFADNAAKRFYAAPATDVAHDNSNSSNGPSL